MSQLQFNTAPISGSAHDADRRISTVADARSRRGLFIKWLRKTHGWIGLWGAALGLLFGVTGVLLNHRAILKIPAAHAIETVVQLPLPNPAPGNAKSMASWLRTELALDRDAARVRSEPSQTVPWGDKTIKQPARWSASFSSAKFNVQAEYWLGNNFVIVKRNDNNVFAMLNNLHKGSGLGIGWILLVDTLAGSIIFLSLTGVLLWALLNRRRMVGTSIGIASIAAAVGFVTLSL